jgi:nucleotidyltransferase/DNA polymerase involved in DNA repair
MDPHHRAPNKPSPAAAAPSFSEAGEEYQPSEFGGIRDYKRRKRLKLQNQDATSRASSSSPQIFKGHIISSLGYTNPNSNVLRQMVVKHGGVWREFKDGGSTICVATALPAKKREEMKRIRFVRPEWIVECVNQGKIVDWSRFRIGGEQAQMTLGFDGKVMMPKTPAESYRDVAGDEVVKKALETVRLPRKSQDWEIPASDDEEKEEEEEFEDDPVDRPRSEVPEVQEDGIPPSAQPPLKWDSEEEEYYIDDDEDLWMEDPDGQLAPPSHQPERRYVSISEVEDSEEEEEEEEEDTVHLVPVPEAHSPKDNEAAADEIPPETSGYTESQPPPPTAKIKGVDAYEAEAVIGEKKHPANKKPKHKRGKMKYLIRWKGYPDEEATWEWEDTLREDLGDDVVDEMCAQYYASQQVEPQGSRRGSQKKSRKSRKQDTSQKTSSGSQQKISSLVIKPSSQGSSKEKTSVAPEGSLRRPLPESIPDSFSSVNLSETEDDAQVLPPLPQPQVTKESRSSQLQRDDSSKLPRGFSYILESFSSVNFSDANGDAGDFFPQSHQPEPLQAAKPPLPRGFSFMPESFSSVSFSDAEADLPPPLPTQEDPQAAKPQLPKGFSDMPESFSSVKFSDAEDDAGNPIPPSHQPEVPQVVKPALPRGFSFMPTSFSSVHLTDPDDAVEAPQTAKKSIPPSRLRREAFVDGFPTSYQLPVVDEEEEDISSSDTEVILKPSQLQEIEDDTTDLPQNKEGETDSKPSIHPAMEIPNSFSSIDLMSDIVLPEGYTTPPPPSSPPEKTPKTAILKRSASIASPVSTAKKLKSTDFYKEHAPAQTVTSSKEPPRLTKENAKPHSSPQMAASSKEPRRLSKENATTPEEFNEIFLSDPKVRAASVLNPDFLPKFFKESRLHYLSTWKAELRSRMQERALFSSQPSAQSRAVRYVMHVDFDCFFAAVSTRDRPDLKDKPVAICHGRTENSTTSEIASCNYAARKFGVRNGMWMAKAKELCPDIVTLGYDFEKYEEASEEFYGVVLALGAERVQAVSVDEVLLDISNLVCNEQYSDQGREEAAAQKLATKVRDECRKKTGCEVSVGIGMNVAMARLALRKAKPAGQFIIRRSEVRAFLDELKVSAFPGVGEHTANKIIEKFGSDSVLEVRKIPRERLKQTLGAKTGERVYELCNGIDNTLVGAAETPRESISISVNWGVRFTRTDQAEEFLHRLSRAVEEKMKSERVKGRVLNFKVAKRALNAPFETEKFLGCGKVDEINKKFVFGVPTNDAALLARKCIELLRSFRVSPGDIRGFTMGMKDLEDEANNDGQQQLQFKKAVETKVDAPSKRPPPQQPELKPAAPVKIKAYVKPKPMTLFDAFSKKAGKKQSLPAPPPAPAVTPEPTAHHQSPSPVVGRSRADGPQLPSPDRVFHRSPEASTSQRPRAMTPQASTSETNQQSQAGRFIKPAPPSTTKAQAGPITPVKTTPVTPTKASPQVVQATTPQFPSTQFPQFPATQFDIPPASQIDESVLPFLPIGLQELVRQQQREQRERDERRALEPEPELEMPPNSQWDIEAWNSFSQGVRDSIRADHEREKAAEAQRKNAVSPQKPKPQSGPSKPKQQQQQQHPLFRPPSDRGGPSNPRHPKVYDRHRNEVSSWLFAPRSTGGAGIDPEIFQLYDQAEQATIVQDAVAARERQLPKETADKTAKERRNEELMNEVLARLAKRQFKLRLPGGGEACTTNVEGVRDVIRDWIKNTEEPEEEDLETLCGFLKAVTLDEVKVDKAATHVKWVLVLAGKKEGWWWVCQGVVDTVRAAARELGIPNLQFD